MSHCVQQYKDKNKRLITQISENEYLVEGKSDYAKFGCESDLCDLTFANLEGGPFLYVGDNFLGKGRITQIQNIETDQTDYIIIKVTVSNYESTT
jgi:hypothetical protein